MLLFFFYKICLIYSQQLFFLINIFFLSLLCWVQILMSPPLSLLYCTILYLNLLFSCLFIRFPSYLLLFLFVSSLFSSLLSLFFSSHLPLLLILAPLLCSAPLLKSSFPFFLILDSSNRYYRCCMMLTEKKI